MKQILYACVYSLLGLLTVSPAFAHEGDDHAEAQTTAVERRFFTIEAVSDKYELLLRYEPIVPGEPANMQLFVSEYASNRPVNLLTPAIISPEDAAVTFSTRQTAEGTYAVEAVFPQEKTYSLAVKINGPLGADLLLLPHIEVGKELTEANTEEHTSAFPWLTVLGIALALVVGLLLGMLFQRRRTTRGKTFISVGLLATVCLMQFQPLMAHGGDDHDAPEPAAGTDFSGELDVPKETQFLFGILTERVQSGSFTESTKLFGTIIPSSGGQAVISTPQSGKIVSLHVRVGEHVKAGQLLAVVEQNIDAGTQVGLLSEKNNLTAEYEAAKKEWERLMAIQDIAAKKDLDEAKSRLQKAESNLRLFTGNSGKTIHLLAPIDGIAGNYNLSVGSTVNAGQTIFTITDLNKVYAEAQVFDKDAGKVMAGARYTVECSNDSHKTGEVTLLSVAQEINATNQSQRVLFELKNPGGDFKIGEFVNIRVFAPQDSKQISLPNSAVSEINGKPVVFVKDKAEKYAIRYVQLGENNGSHSVISKGVAEGDRVVVEGSYQLKMIYLNQ